MTRVQRTLGLILVLNVAVVVVKVVVALREQLPAGTNRWTFISRWS